MKFFVTELAKTWKELEIAEQIIKDLILRDVVERNYNDDFLLTGCYKC